ncbi:hypothetical protein AOC36_04985 [Erysipelothrix larvae]|uniref:Competence protein ComGF n=1 Tax=Erysipelothrix larvae TaxID=1514105 RepID=A0A0X8GZM0_9FIRM|nr:hypothetical protein AOC36_04985 [Erysipelothrix larvae]
MKRGYTLVNYLLGLFCVMVLLHVSSLILRILINHNTPFIAQNELFELQILNLYTKTNAVTCDKSLLTIDESEIVFDRERIIKRPGYEILLQDVQSIEFSCSNPIKLIYVYKGNRYELSFEKPKG